VASEFLYCIFQQVWHPSAEQSIEAQFELVQSALAMHIFPLAQVCSGAQLPPQSTSVSLPFFTRSEQVGAVQTSVAAGQYSGLEQSLLAAQPTPAAQRGQAFAPPQSTPVSTPFFTLSVQEGAAHSPAVHTPLAQSEPVPHPWLVPQRAQVLAPPQSTPVSRPFFTPSVQLGAAHRPAWQTPLEQLAPLVPHIWPTAQVWLVGAATQEPPQSTSLSLPFFSVSLQLAGVQVPFAPQMPFTQSAATAHPFPSAHLWFVGEAAHDPPQSGAVSLPFFTPSVQVGTAQAPEVHTPLVQLAPAPVPVPHILPSPQGGHEPPQSTSVSVLFFTVSAQLAAAQTPLTHTPLVQSPDTPQA